MWIKIRIRQIRWIRRICRIRRVRWIRRIRRVRRICQNRWVRWIHRVRQVPRIRRIGVRIRRICVLEIACFLKYWTNKSSFCTRQSTCHVSLWLEVEISIFQWKVVTYVTVFFWTLSDEHLVEQLLVVFWISP